MVSFSLLPKNGSCPAWLVYVGELLATGLLLALSLAPDRYFDKLAPIQFIERDPALSYALVEPETVPVSLLFGIAAGIPLAVITLGHTFFLCKTRPGLKGCTSSLFWILLAFLQAMVICAAVTNLLKTAAGRPRPNFFALCNYAGYYDGLKSGNLTSYYASTQFGAFGDVSKCQGVASLGSWTIDEARRSFPSGHSSFSFASMLFVTLYLRAALNLPGFSYISLRGLISAVPLVIACYVAISRWRDKWHNIEDILAGSIIGWVSTLFAWRHYTVHKRMVPAGEATHAPGEVVEKKAEAHSGASAALAVPLSGDARSYA